MRQDTRSYIWASPQPGKIMEVPAGARGEFSFRCTNDTESPVVYEPRVEGLPQSWVAPESESQVLGPFDEREIKFILTPPADSELGDYPFKVGIWADGSLLDPPGERGLFLRVAPSLEPHAPAKPEKPPKEKVTKEKQARERAKVFDGREMVEEVAVSDWQPEEVSAVVTPEPEPEPAVVVSQVEKETPRSEPEPQPEPELKAEPEPEPEPIVIDLEEEEPEPEQEPLPPPEPEPEPEPEDDAPTSAVESQPEPEGVGWFKEGEVIKREKPKPKSEPEPKPEPVRRVARVVDLEEEDEDTQAPAPMADKVIVDPKDGTVVSVRPGETALVTFRFTNLIPVGQRPEARTYVLQEDRSLPSDWIKIVQDQVNVTPNGTGELRVVLQPPKSAEPANYPFTISTGPYGQPLTPCSLILNVQAVPVVALAAKAAKSTTGPLGRNCDFQLSVSNAGNADTAYRIAVRDPSVDKDSMGRPQSPDELYETAHWRYFFDKEMDSLITPSSARARQPNEHRLRLHRRGVWWFGFTEKHKVRVTAAPVTDPSNARNPVNTVELVAMRWRLTPLPWFLMVPLTLLFLILVGSSPKEFDTTNTFDGEGARFVLGSEVGEGRQAMTVQAKWDAPFYAWVKVGKSDTESSDTHVSQVSRNSFTVTVEVSNYAAERLVKYHALSAITSAGGTLDVRFVPLRTEQGLTITGIDGGSLGPAVTEEPYPFGKSGTVTGMTYDISVPADPSRVVNVRFRNTISEARGIAVVLWVAKSAPNFQMTGLTEPGKSREIPASNSIPVKFSYRGGSGDESDEIWLLTTDKSHQFIRIRLRVAP